MMERVPDHGADMRRSGSSLRERLGVYLLGVAIGLTIVGMIFMARYQAQQRQEAARQAAREAAGASVEPGQERLPPP
jgi:hypothetical protein